MLKTALKEVFFHMGGTRADPDCKSPKNSVAHPNSPYSLREVLITLPTNSAATGRLM